VFVNDGQVLTIEAGTVIRARTGQGSASSALIVARGGKIIASGTPEKSIIFTVDGDDLEGSVPLEAKGLWGGLILLGQAPINIAGGEAHIEGIPVYGPRGLFGGSNENDDSGILQYVSIRHSGTNIGEGNEINGLTLAGVGAESTIDHIEVISCADDGVEIFGGNANIKYLIVGLSGGIDPITGQPYTQPVIYNATMVGRNAPEIPHSMLFDRNGGGYVVNSVFLNQAQGLYVEFVEGSQSSYDMLTQENLQIISNMYHDIAAISVASICQISASPGVDVSQQKEFLQNHFTQNNNEIANPGIDINGDHIDPLPKGDVYQNIYPIPDSWFETTIFKGAFYTYNWASGWSLASQAGFID